MSHSKPDSSVAVLQTANGLNLAEMRASLTRYGREYQSKPNTKPALLSSQYCALIGPFFARLVREGYSQSTLKRHVNYLETLGAELMRDCFKCSGDLRDQVTDTYVRDWIQQECCEEGGPVIEMKYLCGSQAEFDRTCSLFYRFLEDPNCAFRRTRSSGNRGYIRVGGQVLSEELEPYYQDVNQDLVAAGVEPIPVTR